ncbi:hypothetical protein OG21DRAFT_849683 [Imleria badia]|nr:hypothetical protein OG21DRAFT_849683 [Imleria badia]
MLYPCLSVSHSCRQKVNDVGRDKVGSTILCKGLRRGGPSSPGAFRTPDRLRGALACQRDIKGGGLSVTNLRQRQASASNPRARISVQTSESVRRELERLDFRCAIMPGTWWSSLAETWRNLPPVDCLISILSLNVHPSPAECLSSLQVGKCLRNGVV